MHRTWVLNVKNKLVTDDYNNLTIYFYSAPLYDIQAEMDFRPYVLPFNYSHSRKASYHYGWDWGPRLVTSGIWKPIKIRYFDRV